MNVLWTSAFTAILALALLASGCGGPRLENGYRPDETAQLELLLTQMLMKEQAQDWIDLYRDHASNSMQQHTPERVFLQHAQCLTQSFGKLTRLPSPLPTFSRSGHPTLGTTETASTLLHYERGEVLAKYVLIPAGDTFKLWQLNWQPRLVTLPQSKTFKTCIAKTSREAFNPLAQPETQALPTAQ
ncbi:MAG: hypothetical protein VKJ06_05170 [Vampirovibrionales bacterium]|nr:hypothetical protein [Vampirovibrionales bacterium]